MLAVGCAISKVKLSQEVDLISSTEPSSSVISHFCVAPLAAAWRTIYCFVVNGKAQLDESYGASCACADARQECDAAVYLAGFVTRSQPRSKPVSATSNASPNIDSAAPIGRHDPYSVYTRLCRRLYGEISSLAEKTKRLQDKSFMIEV